MARNSGFGYVWCIFNDTYQLSCTQCVDCCVDGWAHLFVCLAINKGDLEALNPNFSEARNSNVRLMNKNDRNHVETIKKLIEICPHVPALARKNHEI